MSKATERKLLQDITRKMGELAFKTNVFPYELKLARLLLAKDMSKIPVKTTTCSINYA